jgi:hypothetical protein
MRQCSSSLALMLTCHPQLLLMKLTKRYLLGSNKQSGGGRTQKYEIWNTKKKAAQTGGKSNQMYTTFKKTRFTCTKLDVVAKVSLQRVSQLPPPHLMWPLSSGCIRHHHSHPSPHQGERSRSSSRTLAQNSRNWERMVYSHDLLKLESLRASPTASPKAPQKDLEHDGPKNVPSHIPQSLFLSGAA